VISDLQLVMVEILVALKNVFVMSYSKHELLLNYYSSTHRRRKYAHVSPKLFLWDKNDVRSAQCVMHGHVLVIATGHQRSLSGSKLPVSK